MRLANECLANEVSALACLALVAVACHVQGMIQRLERANDKPPPFTAKVGFLACPNITAATTSSVPELALQQTSTYAVTTSCK